MNLNDPKQKELLARHGQQLLTQYQKQMARYGQQLLTQYQKQMLAAAPAKAKAASGAATGAAAAASNSAPRKHVAATPPAQPSQAAATPQQQQRRVLVDHQAAQSTQEPKASRKFPDDASDDMRSEEEQPLMTRRQAFAVLVTMLVAAFSLFALSLVMNFVWKSASREALDGSLEQMGVELHTSANSIVEDVFLIPQIVAFLGQVFVELEELQVSVEDNAWLPSTDRYFLEFLDQHNVTAIFIGTERGDFTGSFVVLDGERRGELSIKTSTETVDHQVDYPVVCRQWFYATRDAADPHCNATDEHNADGEYDKCEQCRESTTTDEIPGCYATTQRTWYTGARERHEKMLQGDPERGDSMTFPETPAPTPSPTVAPTPIGTFAPTPSKANVPTTVMPTLAPTPVQRDSETGALALMVLENYSVPLEAVSIGTELPFHAVLRAEDPTSVIMLANTTPAREITLPGQSFPQAGELSFAVEAQSGAIGEYVLLIG